MGFFLEKGTYRRAWGTGAHLKLDRRQHGSDLIISCIIIILCFSRLSFLQENSNLQIDVKVSLSVRHPIGHQARLQENNDFPLGRAPAIKKKPPFIYARARHSSLVTHEIMRSNDAQCKKKWRGTAMASIGWIRIHCLEDYISSNTRGTKTSIDC